MLELQYDLREGWRNTRVRRKGRISLKATPHATDPLNEVKKKECLAETGAFDTKMESKGMQNNQT